MVKFTESTAESKIVYVGFASTKNPRFPATSPTALAANPQTSSNESNSQLFITAVSKPTIVPSIPLLGSRPR